jgi:site-specific recombinase XerD
LYEYGNYHDKFINWLETRKKSKHIPIRAIQRADIADFIDDLLEEGLSGRTIQQKYLAAINGLFSLAQSTGALPEGVPLVSHGHKILTNTDLKKAGSSGNPPIFEAT